MALMLSKKKSIKHYTSVTKVGTTYTLPVNTSFTSLDMVIPDAGQYAIALNGNEVEPSGYRPVYLIIDNYQLAYCTSPSDWSIDATTHKVSGPVLSGNAPMYVDLWKFE